MITLFLIALSTAISTYYVNRLFHEIDRLKKTSDILMTSNATNRAFIDELLEKTYVLRENINILHAKDMKK
jgi:hypothetical protein